MLTALYPIPVPLRVGGETHHALPLRVRDLAQLEQLARHILLGWDPLRDVATDAELVAAYDAHDPLPLWGTDDCHDAIFGTPTGLAGFLKCLLRFEQLEDADARRLANTVQAAEWPVIQHVAFGSDPRQVVLDEIDRRAGVSISRPKDGGLPWSEAAVMLTGEPWHMSPADVGDLPITALRAILAEGKVAEMTTDQPPGMKDEAFAAELAKRAAFFEAHAVNG